MKAKPWEFIAVDLVYRDKDQVTVALLPRDYPDIMGWINANVKKPAVGESCFVYSYGVVLQ